MKKNSTANNTRWWIWLGLLATTACGLYLGYVATTALRDAGQELTFTGETQVPSEGVVISDTELPPLPVPGKAELGNGSAPSLASSDPATKSYTPPITEDVRELVRAQAQYLRELSARNTDPDGINKLTPEEIDEMEKKGILVC